MVVVAVLQPTSMYSVQYSILHVPCVLYSVFCTCKCCNETFNVIKLIFRKFAFFCTVVFHVKNWFV